MLVMAVVDTQEMGANDTEAIDFRAFSELIACAGMLNRCARERVTVFSGDCDIQKGCAIC